MFKLNKAKTFSIIKTDGKAAASRLGNGCGAWGLGVVGLGWALHMPSGKGAKAETKEFFFSGAKFSSFLLFICLAQSKKQRTLSGHIEVLAICSNSRAGYLDVGQLYSGIVAPL